LGFGGKIWTCYLVASRSYRSTPPRCLSMGLFPVCGPNVLWVV
jgi:hypothetical protein